MPINTVTQQAPQQNFNKPRTTCHHCKKPGHYQNQCRQLKREKDQTRNSTNSANNNNNGSAQTNSNPNHNKVANDTKGSNTNNQRDRRPRPVFPPCETCGRTNHSTEKCYLGANAANRPPPRNRRPEGENQSLQNNAQNNSDKNVCWSQLKSHGRVLLSAFSECGHKESCKYFFAQSSNFLNAISFKMERCIEIRAFCFFFWEYGLFVLVSSSHDGSPSKFIWLSQISTKQETENRTEIAVSAAWIFSTYGSLIVAVSYVVFREIGIEKNLLEGKHRIVVAVVLHRGKKKISEK